METEGHFSAFSSKLVYLCRRGRGEGTDRASFSRIVVRGTDASFPALGGHYRIPRFRKYDPPPPPLIPPQPLTAKLL